MDCGYLIQSEASAGADAVHKAMRDNMLLLEPVMRL